MNSASHTVTERHMSRNESGQSSVTDVTQPFRGVTSVTVMHPRRARGAGMAEKPELPAYKRTRRGRRLMRWRPGQGRRLTAGWLTARR